MSVDVLLKHLQAVYKEECGAEWLKVRGNDRKPQTPKPKNPM